MGANATTFVPAYVSGEVLTAADLTVTNSGVPVFADTTARDAAFGGAGEKVLAEGQLAYIENLDVVQYYSGSVWATVGPASAGALVLISATTIGNAVASVTVSNAFSSTYDNYHISLVGGVASANADLSFQLGATTSGYYCGYSQVTYSSGAASAASNNNAASFTKVGVGTADSLFMNINVMGPNLAKVTGVNGAYGVNLPASTSVLFAGMLYNTTVYTAFTIAPSSGTLTGGTIRVYGYANS